MFFMVRCGGWASLSPRMSKRLYVVAGELSGDAHGAGLLRALKAMVPAVEIHGVGRARRWRRSPDLA